MGMLRFDHVGVVVDDLGADVVMVRTPDRTGKLELVKYHSPTDDTGAQSLPPNRPGFRHIAIEVEDVNGTVDRLRDEGLHPVGEVADYGNVYRLVYVRGPEGLIVELAQAVDS